MLRRISYRNGRHKMPYFVGTDTEWEAFVRRATQMGRTLIVTGRTDTYNSNHIKDHASRCKENPYTPKEEPGHSAWLASAGVGYG